MPFNIQNLNYLTHSRLNAVIESLFNLDGGPILLNFPTTKKHTTSSNENSLFYLNSVHARLLALIDPKDKSEEVFGFCLKVLAKLLGGEEEELERLNNNSKAVVATRIFLNFKLKGEKYQSIHGHGNTCLHDAVLSCAWHKESLTTLLLQHGANPAKTNDKGITAAGLYMKQSLPEASAQFLWVHKSTTPSFKRKMLLFVAWTLDTHPESTLKALKGLNLYLPSKTTPGLLDFIPKINSNSTLLHHAVRKGSKEVVLWMLKHEANPLLLNGNKKPMDYAIQRLYNLKGQVGEEGCLDIIAYLLIYELMQSKPNSTDITTLHIVFALLELDIRQYRLRVVNKLMKMEEAKSFTFSEKELITNLLITVKEVARENYSLCSKIGEGSFGNVYKWKNNANNQWPKKVAIKLAKGNVTGELRREALILSQLNHPNIIEYYGVFERDGFGFGYVMHYAEGGSFERFLKTIPYALSPFGLSHFARQIVSGQRYLHANGIVNLDLKPNNIVIEPSQYSPFPALKLIDFGSAAKVGDFRPNRVTTEHYCSPEGFDILRPYTKAEDVFSFGVCLGYIDTLKEPWEELGEDDDTKLQSIEWAVRNGIRTTYDGYLMTDSVAELVNRCWEQEPAKRPTFDEIAEYVETKLTL